MVHKIQKSRANGLENVSLSWGCTYNLEGAFISVFQGGILNKKEQTLLKSELK